MYTLSKDYQELFVLDISIVLAPIFDGYTLIIGEGTSQ